MPSDVQRVSATFVHFYQFGIRLRQAEMLHGNNTGMSRWSNKASPTNVSSMLFRLRSAAEDLVDVVQLPQFSDRVDRAMRIIEEGWNRWVRTAGYGEDPLTVQQGLNDIEEVVQGLAARLGSRVQQARAWLELGKSMVEYLLRGPQTAAEEPLHGLLGEVGVKLAELLPQEGDAGAQTLLGLPEDYQSWHRLEGGLHKLFHTSVPDSDTAASGEARESVMEQRNRWIYEQALDVNNTWDEIRLRMSREHPEWAQLESKQAAQQAAKRYVDTHEVGELPPRQNK